MRPSNRCRYCGEPVQWLGSYIHNIDGSPHKDCKPKVKIYTKEELAEFAAKRGKKV